MIPACIMNTDVYAARIPRKSQYYRCVEAHFEELVGTWDDRYQQDYGYWRPYVLDVIYKYLDCGDLYDKSFESDEPSFYERPFWKYQIQPTTASPHQSRFFCASPATFWNNILSILSILLSPTIFLQ
jgi:hypothetical protein